MKVLGELKTKCQELEGKFSDVKVECTKNKNDNLKLRHRNKQLAEEHSALAATYEYILANYDVSSNIKRINLDDIKSVSESNNVVNRSISNMVDKLADFKKKNAKQLL